MRLVTFTHQAQTRVGRLEGEEVVDLGASGLPREMCALLAAGAKKAEHADGPRLPLADVQLRAPVLAPQKILAVALNYAGHAAETGREKPPVPMIFNKQSTAVTGPTGVIHLPRVSSKLDYEGELALVIGHACRHVPRARAHEVIAGYTIANDVTVRDWQARSPTMTMGKSFDTHCPLGPALVTADELGAGAADDAPPTLTLRTTVNGEERQHANTRDLIFDGFALVEHLSTAFTLLPGDVVLTGTPSGVGVAMKPARWLGAGDVVRVEIETLGAIENRVVPEPDDTRRPA